MDQVFVDLINNGQAQGELANSLINNGRLNIGAMRPFVDMSTGKSFVAIYKGGDPKKPENYHTREIQNNATLRRDEWKQLDAAIMEVSRQRLGGIQDLIEKNLTFNLGNAMGTTVLEWHDISEAMEASITMDGVTRSKGDRLNYQTNYLPLPIIHVDYEINARVLAASRSLGNPLDTTSAERAARRINETLEKMLFTNMTYSFGEVDDRGRNKIYSYLNHPDRNIIRFTEVDGQDWTASATSAEAIVKQVLAMKQVSINNYHYGPWMLYIPTAYETRIDEDYKDSLSTGSTNTIRERILKIAGIQGIKVIDTLPENNVLLVQMTSDVVRLVRGMGLQNVEWETEGKMITKYKVMTIQVPQIRSDQNGKSGIVHLA